jgi:hypothetical protein
VWRIGWRLHTDGCPAVRRSLMGAGDGGSLALPSPLYLRRIKYEGGHFGSHSPLTRDRFLLHYNRGRLRVERNRLVRHSVRECRYRQPVRRTIDECMAIGGDAPPLYTRYAVK